MADLDELLALPGAVASFTFDGQGKVLAFRTTPRADIGEMVLDMVSHICVANTAIATMQARGWEYLTGAQGFYPIEGMSFIGFEWSVVSRGQVGIILDNNQADYEVAFAALASQVRP